MLTLAPYSQFVRKSDEVMGVTSFIAMAGISTTAAALADPPYRNRNDAHADGRYNIPSSDPAYRPELDRDGDGFA
jgi:Excalibur calcium-binding domain